MNAEGRAMLALRNNFPALFGSRTVPVAPPAAAEAMTFHSSARFTLGVELEVQILDAATGRLVPRAEALLAAAKSGAKLKPELYQDMIELNTSICNGVREVEADLAATMDRLVAAGGSLGVAFASTGTHPAANHADSDIYPAERYSELIDRNQWLARKRKVYGLHVHIGMESGDECIRFNNFFLRLLPHLLALSASAPFWRYEDTGLATCRPSIYEALPTAGLPYLVRNWHEFVMLCQALREARAIGSLKDLWWNVRPSPDFGTLEIRVCDSPATLAETIAIVAFIHLLALWFAGHGDWLQQVPQPPHWLMRENKWRVIRHGLEANLVTSTGGANRPVRADILNWIDRVERIGQELGYGAQLDMLRAICAKGNSSARQHAMFATGKSLDEVIRFNMREFAARTPLWETEGEARREEAAQARPIALEAAEGLAG